MADTTGAGTTDRGIVLEIGALVLLTLGSVISWVGWAGGVLLLWTSDRWTRRDKLLGSLVLPGGLAGAVWFTHGPATTTCTVITVGGSSSGGLDASTLSCADPLLFPLPVVLAFQLVLIVAPLAVAVWLGWRVRRTG